MPSAFRTLNMQRIFKAQCLWQSSSKKLHWRVDLENLEARSAHTKMKQRSLRHSSKEMLTAATRLQCPSKKRTKAKKAYKQKVQSSICRISPTFCPILLRVAKALRKPANLKILIFQRVVRPRLRKNAKSGTKITTSVSLQREWDTESLIEMCIPKKRSRKQARESRRP